MQFLFALIQCSYLWENISWLLPNHTQYSWPALLVACISCLKLTCWIMYSFINMFIFFKLGVIECVLQKVICTYSPSLADNVYPNYKLTWKIKSWKRGAYAYFYTIFKWLKLLPSDKVNNRLQISANIWSRYFKWSCFFLIYRRNVISIHLHVYEIKSIVAEFRIGTVRKCRIKINI